MIKHTEPDQTLIKMPSLTAVKSFVAAARYQNFTRAAESLCVTQAAISRQVRELEGFLGTDLFKRVGRSIELTPEGSIFFDAAQLSFINIANAADRIRNNRVANTKRTITLCCSPAFSAFWLSHRLPSFFSQHSNIDLQVLSTENFLTMEPGVHPDIFITKMQKVREGYHSIPLFHDVIYPICTPSYLAAHPELSTLEGLRDGVLLNLSPYGRSQVSEHVNWEAWLAIHKVNTAGHARNAIHTFNANDYSMLVHMTLKDQGVALGWDHLVSPLIADGQLVKPLDKELILEGTQHYLAYREDKEADESISIFRQWFMDQCATYMNLNA